MQGYNYAYYGNLTLAQYSSQASNSTTDATAPTPTGVANATSYVGRDPNLVKLPSSAFRQCRPDLCG